MQLVKSPNKPWSLFVRQFAESDKPLPSDPVVSSEKAELCVSAAQREVPVYCSADGGNTPRLATCSGGRPCTSGVHVSGRMCLSLLLHCTILSQHVFFFNKHYHTTSCVCGIFG